MTRLKFLSSDCATIVGMGLLEAITEADILANTDPDDTDGDGIRGVVRIVTTQKVVT